MATLLVTEQRDLAACEATIERGMSTFVAVGQALARIRDGRLYRDTHKTFAAYCKDRWDRSREWAFAMIDSAAAAENVYESTQNGPAINATQARELAKAPAEDQPAIWCEVVEESEAAGEPVTAAKVAEKVAAGPKLAPKREPKPKSGIPLVATKDRKEAAALIGKLVRLFEKIGRLSRVQDALDTLAAEIKR